MNLNTFLNIFHADDSCLSEVHNQIRVKFFKEWFTKCSFTFKIQTLKELLNKINNNVVKEIIIAVIGNFPEKLLAYVTYQTIPKRIRDRCLKDHNRSLEEETLRIVQHEYVTWYSDLTDIAQITVFVGLLRIGGAGIIIKLHDLLFNQSTLPRIQHDTNVSEKLQYIITDRSKKEDNIREKRSNKSLTNNIINKEKELLNENLKNSLKKYALELDKQVKKIYGVKATKVKKAKNKSKKKKTKESINSKKTKKKKNEKAKKSKSKKSKSTKKSKKRRKEKEETDWLQTLPIWVVKNIFSYLDKKTLKRIKDVNSYWAYVVDALIADQKIRKYIDKHIKQSEKTLKMLEENISSNWNRIEESKSRKKDLSSRDERIKRLIGRGALHIKLKPKFSPSNIITNADTDQVEFPHILVEMPKLKANVSCMLDEIYYNNLQHNEENLKCPSNFL